MYESSVLQRLRIRGMIFGVLQGLDGFCGPFQFNKSEGKIHVGIEVARDKLGNLLYSSAAPSKFF